MIAKQIEPILRGTVIDHIPAGLGQTLFQLIGQSPDIVVIGLNLFSSKLGKKDLLKYANKALSAHDLDLIATLSDVATVSIIEESVVKEKFHPQKPDVIEGILACPNPKCITNIEYAITKFWTKPTFRCYFCERTLKHNDVRYVKSSTSTQ